MLLAEMLQQLPGIPQARILSLTNSSYSYSALKQFNERITIYPLRIRLKRIYKIFGNSFEMKRKNFPLFQMNISLTFNVKIVH